MHSSRTVDQLRVPQIQNVGQFKANAHPFLILVIFPCTCVSARLGRASNRDMINSDNKKTLEHADPIDSLQFSFTAGELIYAKTTSTAG
jgi:hypothetical protein